MFYAVLLFLVFILLVFALWISVGLGRRYGRIQLEHHIDHRLEVVTVAESAVFALLGLLIAFTFAGAYDRFEHRKMHLVEEASAFSKAYEYIDLLSPKYQPVIRRQVRQYLDLHLNIYRDLPNLKKAWQDIDRLNIMQNQIWHTVTLAVKGTPDKYAELLVVPAMDDMFTASYTGINMARIHPPIIIFLLLIMLAALGAFLVGYIAAENQQKNPVHIASYVILTAFIIYIITNIEFPRVGFVRLNMFDQLLVDVREGMGQS